MSKQLPKLLWVCCSAAIVALLVFAFKKPEASHAPAPAAMEAFPTDYFANPVDDNIKLTGTFGELRPDHFHSGIDIKSKTGGVGQPVFASAEGFVDRIKVQAGGYGRVVYIRHPNGYITVYAHLEKFNAELEKYVKDAQYQKERFEVDLNPKDHQFDYKKGEEIGKLGNSGGSTGPHLHFEIRRTSDDKALNPLLFGLPVTDDVAPDIRDFKVYFINDKQEIVASKNIDVAKGKDGRFRLKGGDTLRLGTWRVGFGVKTYDQMTGFKNDNGIYAITMAIDDGVEYHYRMDALDFDETRYVNAHMDYPTKVTRNAYFHRCFLLPGNRLSNYTETQSKGVVALYKDNPRKVTIKIADTQGNHADLDFWVVRTEPSESFAELPYHYFLPFDQESKIETSGLQAHLAKGVLYENLYLQYHISPEFSNGIYSSVHHVHNEAVPAHKFFEIALTPENVPAELRDKAIIARCDKDDKPVNCGGSWKENRLTTRTRSFGDYCIMTDTEAPSIVPVVFDDDMRKKSQLSFRIRDNFAIGGTADGLYYRGTVDGKWILFDYDRKKDRLTHVFDGRIGPGKHILKLVVRDDRGNEAVFEREFLR